MSYNKDSFDDKELTNMANDIVADMDHKWINAQKENSDEISQSDLNVCKSNHMNCNKNHKNIHLKKNKSNKSDAIISNCSHLQRATAALRHYDTLKMDNKLKSTDGIKKFTIFCQNSYKHFLNDYIHIITKHGDDLLFIQNELFNEYKFTKCAVAECTKLQRHYGPSGRETVKNNDSLDAKEEFYRSYFDQLHHFIFHLYDVGVRTDIKETFESKEHTENDFLSIDKVFAAKRDIIRSKREQYATNMGIDRYDDENNKFMLKLDSTNSINQDGAMTDETFEDELYKAMKNNDNIDDEMLANIQRFMDYNEYDTDAIEQDVEDWVVSNVSTSNIYNHIGNTMVTEFVKQYQRHFKLSETSFSTGFDFGYWGKTTDSEVFCYYKSLKEEIMSSGFISIDDWNDLVVKKAKELFDTEMAKSIENYQYRKVWAEEKTLSITLSHIISIILYCDWSALCTHFSGTFRKKNVFETMESMKKRNEKYFHFSKFLIESVIDFGNDNFIFNPHREPGPFFCGLSFIMTISSFAIHLKGPCSTSKQVEVSLNFAKRTGMIMQMHNDADGCFTKFCDVSWISKFAEEDERLLIHTRKPLRMQSVRIIETAANFKKFMHAFFVFDCMLSGLLSECYGGDLSATSKDVKILEKFTNNKLNGTPLSFDKYIVDCFDLYCYKKEEITIAFEWVEKRWKKISHLFVNNVVNEGYTRDSQRDNIKIEVSEKCRNDPDKNTLKPTVFKIFPNLKKISLKTTSDVTFISDGTYPNYVFLWSSLLSFIQNGPDTILYKIYASDPDETLNSDLHSSGFVAWFHDTEAKETQSKQGSILSASIKEAYNDKGWIVTESKRILSRCTRRMVKITKQ
eukprot:455686_1